MVLICLWNVAIIVHDSCMWAVKWYTCIDYDQQIALMGVWTAAVWWERKKCQILYFICEFTKIYRGKIMYEQLQYWLEFSATLISCVWELVKHSDIVCYSVRGRTYLRMQAVWNRTYKKATMVRVLHVCAMKDPYETRTLD